MTRSKIFLGATTCLLAIAGFAARKHAYTGKTGFYSTIHNANVCTKAVQGNFTTVQKTGEVTATVVTGTHSHILFRTLGSCSNRLYKTSAE